GEGAPPLESCALSKLNSVVPSVVVLSSDIGVWPKPRRCAVLSLDFVPTVRLLSLNAALDVGFESARKHLRQNRQH
ncbi:hypothetical protein, partial [Rouxiella aceris]|uniref:hypothetical protein n=1 Tax=Rouxiella aceris TaxID=2703884 RepID=UPI001B7D4B26